MEPSLQTSMNSSKQCAKSYLFLFEPSLINGALTNGISNLVEQLSAPMLNLRRHSNVVRVLEEKNKSMEICASENRRRTWKTT